MNEWLTTIQAGERLGISRKMIIKLINAGRVVATKVGRDYLIVLSEVEKYQRERKAPGRPVSSKAKERPVTKRQKKAK